MDMIQDTASREGYEWQAEASRCRQRTGRGEQGRSKVVHNRQAETKLAREIETLPYKRVEEEGAKGTQRRRKGIR